MPNFPKRTGGSALSRKPKGNNKVGANKRLGVVRPLTASLYCIPSATVCAEKTRSRDLKRVMIAGVR